MDIKIEKKQAFKVAGYNEQDINSSLCPNVWDKLYGKYSHEELAGIGTGESVGICHDVESPDRINYMAGYITTDIEKAKDMGLEVLEVDEAEYAVVKLTGKVPECIHAGWKYLMEVFFPEHGYIHSGKPDFEYYFKGDMHSSDYKMELWVPVVKA